jgi:hypothetical protein
MKTEKSKFANNGTLSPERKLLARKHDARRKYNLSLEEADYLRLQPCEICGKKEKKMCIDHKIPKTYRGVLCQQCNTRLGWFEKHINTVLAYIERGPQNATN